MKNILTLIITLFFPVSFAICQKGTNPPDYLEMENEALRIRFDKEYGKLIYLEYKRTGWKIENRNELSQSFRMLVPTEDRRDNSIYGKDHRLESYRISNDGKIITLIWKGLKSEALPDLDIKFTGHAELTEKGLKFSAEIENHSSVSIDAVYWPCLGDLTLPDKKIKTNWIEYGYGGGMILTPVSPLFQSDHGYWGVDYPIQTHRTHYSHFGLLQAGSEGLYVEYQDTTDRHLVCFTLELRPGFEYAEGMQTGTVPPSDIINGQSVNFDFSCVHFAYVNPNETAVLEPIVIIPYQGDWHAGVDLYKAWRSTWKRERPLPGWAAEVHSWQQIHINSPEDRPVFMYRELVDYCRECRENNVKAIQLTGWDIGGQDRGDPSHDIEPKLGTYQDLKNAISTCEKMGVRIILFNKYTWVDKTTDWYANELVKYATKDPYGDINQTAGYRYQTITQLQGINNRKLIPLCPLSVGWRNIADKEFMKSIDLGASGMLYDENQHHGGFFYCFDETHGHKVPSDIFQGDKIMVNGFLKIAAEKKPDYLFVGEGNRDLQFYGYPISYFRINRNHIPMQRYALPTEKMMIAVIGHNDRNTINQCLRFNYIISYEPRNFKGKLSEFPLTVAYGNKVDNLRRKYKDYLWDGEFRDTKGATVKSNGLDYQHYSVFVNRKSGKKAIVLMNPDYTSEISVTINPSDNAARWVMVSPEDPAEKQFNGSLMLQPLSAAVIIEK